MTLYEITTGAVGESYGRCYVWAPMISNAVLLFHRHYPEKEVQAVRLLLKKNDSEFITKMSDCGFGDPQLLTGPHAT